MSKRLLFLILLASFLNACGQSGKLYLPNQCPPDGGTAFQFWP